MCKLLCMSLLCLLLLFMFCTSVSFANISFTRMQEIDYTGTKWDMFNYCIEQCCKKSLDEVLQETTSQSDLNNFNTLFNYLESNQYISVDYVLEYNSNNTGSAPNQLFVKLSKSNFTSDYVTFTIYKLKTKTSWWVSKTGPSNSSLGVGSVTIQTNGPRAEFLYNVQNGTTKWYKNTNNQVDPPRYILDFSPYLVGTQTISGINFNLIELNRDTSSIILGNMIGWEHFNNIQILQYKYNNDKSLSFNTYLTYLNDGGVVQNTLYALFNQGYALKFTYDGEETGYYNIYFVSPDFSSGDTISGDLYYGGNQNNDIVPIANIINSQYDVNSGELGAYIDNTLFPSGDLSTIASAYDFDSFENQYFNYIYGFFTNIIDTLTQSGDVTLPISYRNFNLTLKSSDFYVPNNALKTLVTTILIVYTFFLVYQQLDLMFRHIREFNLFGFLHDTDVDYHMFL